MKTFFSILFTLSVCSACADTDFDSLFARSEIIVYGQIVHHTIAPVHDDMGTSFCRMDFWITQICTGGKPVSGKLPQLQAGDTLKCLFYYGGYRGDTLSSSMAYVIPLVRDSTESCGWKLTNADATYGTFTDLSIMTLHCPVKFVISGSNTVLREEHQYTARWSTVKIYFPNGQLKQVYKQKGSSKKIIEKRKAYSQNGRIERSTRSSMKLSGSGTKGVTWVFRDGGKRTCRRSKMRVND